MRGHALRVRGGVAGVGVGVGEHAVLRDLRQPQAVQRHFKGERTGLVAVDGEDGDRAGGLVADGRGVQEVDLAVLLGGVRGPGDAHVENRSAAVLRRLGERVERGLLPRLPAGLGGDRRDDVDQLGEAGDLHAVGVPQQRDEQGAEDDGVGEAVVVLQQPRRLRPVVAAPFVGEGGGAAVLVPDVPLVEGQVDLLLRLQPGADVVGGGHDVLDERLGVHRGGEEGVAVAVALVVVGVQGDVVDQLVGVLQNGRLPGGEGGHGLARTAAGDQLHVRVDLPHGAGGLGGEPPVLLRRLVAGLPGAVHLVAQAPQPDAERVLVAVRDAPLGQLGAAGVVGVLLELDRLRDAARAEVERQHRLAADLADEVDELAQAEAVALRGPPGEVEAPGALVLRAHAVLPLVTRDEVPARVAQGRDAQLPDQVEHVPAEPGLVGGRVAGLVDARVDAPAQVLHEGAEQARVHRGDGEGGVEGETGGVRCVAHAGPCSFDISFIDRYFERLRT